MQIVRSLEESGFLQKVLVKKLKMKQKSKKADFFLLLGTLASSILGRGVIRAGKRVIRAG